MKEQKNQGPLVSFQMFQKFMKDACIIKFVLILIKHFQDINAVFVKVLTQHIPLLWQQKWKLDNRQFCAAILTSLSKAFDCILYDLPIAKLNANGFNQEVLKIINGYLCYRSQKVKESSSFSKELDNLWFVPQGSILAPLLFNIDICDLFFFDSSSDIANYADDITPYECEAKANATKCHFLLLPYKSTTMNINVVQLLLKVVIHSLVIVVILKSILSSQ